jgi:hypothetical protein
MEGILTDMQAQSRIIIINQLLSWLGAVSHGATAHRSWGIFRRCCPVHVHLVDRHPNAERGRGVMRIVRRLERRRRKSRRRALAASVAGSSGLLAVGLLFLPVILSGPVGMILLAIIFIIAFAATITIFASPIGLALA